MKTEAQPLSFPFQVMTADEIRFDELPSEADSEEMMDGDEPQVPPVAAVEEVPSVFAGLLDEHAAPSLK